jgi:recombination protein RecA
MANHALALAEAALRARNLDRTLTTARPAGEAAGAVPTTVTCLDACLGGGLPRGQLSEIAGPRSSGRLTLLLQLFRAAAARGELAALVDTFDSLDVASADAAGVDLDRLLWMRGHDIIRPQPIRPQASGVRPQSSEAGGLSPGPLLDRTIERALKALNLVLQAGGFGVVALDLADAPPAALHRIPFTTWLRVQRTIEGSDTACVLVVPQPLARSAGGLTLSLSGRARWDGDAERSCLLAGVEVAVRVISPRRRVDAEVAFVAPTPDAGPRRHGVSPCLRGLSK